MVEGSMRWCLLLTAFMCGRVPKVSPERLAAMREVKDEESVRTCTLLGRFIGSSTQSSDKGLEQARYEARAKCAESGATDFVYVNESVTPDVITVAAKAYDCGAQK
jgi:hypothetical protein